MREDGLQRVHSLVVKGLADGRKRGLGEPRRLDVVEPGDGHIVGDANPAGDERAHCAERHGVVGGDQRVELDSALLQ